MTRTTQDFAAFLESLKAKNEWREEYVGWQLNAPILNLQKQIGTEKLSGYAKNRLIEYLFRRVELAESNAKPDTLVEDVKGYMLAAMAISEKCADNSCPCPLDLEGTCYALEFRKLCEPGDK